MNIKAENIKPDRPITDILGQLVDRVTTLIRSESALARAEIGKSLTDIVGNVSTLLIGAVLLLPALVILLQALVAALVRAGVNEPWASLIVGGATLVIGILCVMTGINHLKSISLVPKETLKQLQLDVAVVQEIGKNHDA